MVIITGEHKRQVVSDFTRVKLSYENIIHKKVYCDFVLAIPDGKKCMAWFTTTSTSKNICYFLELGNNQQILEVSSHNCCFNETLSYGTIFYGTLFYYNSTTFYSIEDILQYKGEEEVRTQNWQEKMETFNQIFTCDISSVCYNKDFIAFGLPVMKATFNELMNYEQSIPYKLSSIQFRKAENVNTSQFLTISRAKELFKQQDGSNSVSSFKDDIIFKVKAELQTDIYSLYCYDANTKETVYYSVASIPDFKTSVMMNQLFRKIKENNNLDALEESDDENEFENDAEDKFVFLENEINMVCQYNQKFKKWTPLKQSLQKNQIVHLSKLIN